MHMLDRLAWSDMFETFLANKYTAAKRFGLEGCETLIPGMKAAIDRAAELGVTDVVMGMPHRGAWQWETPFFSFTVASLLMLGVLRRTAHASFAFSLHT